MHADTEPRALVALRRPRAQTLARVALFAGFGLLSTAVYLVLYSALRPLMVAPLANLGALTVASIANTEVNRRWTFNRTGGGRFRQHYRAGLLFAVYYASTTGALLWLRAAFPGARMSAEIAVTFVVSAAMTVFRYVALDRWAFARK